MAATTSKQQEPLYKDMTDDELREAYSGWRQTLYNWTQIGSACRNRSRTNRQAGRGTAYALNRVQLIENIARKRGIRLSED